MRRAGALIAILALAGCGGGALIATVRGGGYMFTAAVAKSDGARTAQAKPASRG